MRLALTLLLTAAVIGGTAFASGCGGSDAIDPAVIARAADATTVAGGAHLDLTAEVLGRTVHGTGVLDARGQRAAITMALPNGLGTIEERFLQRTIYFRLPTQLGHGLPGGKHWVRIDLARLLHKQGIDLQRFQGPAGGNPSQQLEQLRHVGQVTRIGEETVGGVSTTHYHAVVDLRRAARRSGATPEGAQRLIAQTGQSTLPVDVWIDRANHIRRESFVFHVRGTTARATMELSRFGEPVRIVPPPAADTADITAQAARAGGFGMGTG